MKYDVVIGNPPYQGRSEAKLAFALYPKFIDKSLKSLKDGGYLVYVTPDSWVKSKSTVAAETRNLILNNNLILVKDANHHFNIGESVSYFIVSNETYKGHTEIYDFKGHFNDNPKSIEDAILDKVFTSHNNIKSRSICIHIGVPDRHKYFKDEPDEQYCIRVYHTIPQTFWARPTIAEWAYTPKVILNGSGYYRVFKPNGPAVSNRHSSTILCEDEAHAEAAAKWLDHKLFHFICQTQRTGGFVNQYFYMFPYPERNIVDIDPYEYFGLTQQEIDKINSI